MHAKDCSGFIGSNGRRQNVVTKTSVNRLSWKYPDTNEQAVGRIKIAPKVKRMVRKNLVSAFSHVSWGTVDEDVW